MIGNNMSLLVLLNSVPVEINSVENLIFAEEKIPQSYMQKITRETTELHKKMLIDKGGFDKVRFVLRLCQKNHTVGELLCVKKSKCYCPFEIIKEEMKQRKEVLENCLNDYCSDKFAELVYSPDIYDMLIMAGFFSRNKDYVFQKVITTVTGEAAKYTPEWSKKKRYFMEVFKRIDKLLDARLALTNLQPGNTLFDSRTGRIH